MRRLDSEPDSVVDWQLMLDREVHLTSGTRRLMLLAHEPALLPLSQSVLRSSTIGMLPFQSRPNSTGLQAMLDQGVLDANGTHHSNWLEPETQFLLISQVVLHSRTTDTHHSRFALGFVID